MSQVEIIDEKNRKELHEKSLLRDETFKKFFDNQEGYTLETLGQIFQSYSDIYKEIENKLIKNCRFMQHVDKIRSIKKIEYNNRNYYVLMIAGFRYLVIDLENNVVIDEKSSKELKTQILEKVCDKDIIEYTTLSSYKGNIQELIENINENYELLKLFNDDIYYEVTNKNATAFIYMKIPAQQIQLYFRTEDQYLYETIFMNLDLKVIFEDAKERITRARMEEMADRLKECIIPSDMIPEELHDFIKRELKNNSVKKLTKKINKE